MKGRKGGVGNPLMKMLLFSNSSPPLPFIREGRNPTLPQYASPYEGEEGWSWESLNEYASFFFQLFPNPSLHKGREKSNSSPTLPFIREGRLHAACNTKRGCYCGQNRDDQLNNCFPSFLFHFSHFLSFKFFVLKDKENQEYISKRFSFLRNDCVLKILI